MQYELEEHQYEYFSFTYEDWCELLSTIQVKDERKREATQIKKITSARVASIFDIDKSTSIPRKKKASTGILRSNKIPHKKAHKYHGTQRYCMIFKKAGMPEYKYMLYGSKDCTGISTKQIIKYNMGGSVGSSVDTVKQYNKSEKNGRKI